MPASAGESMNSLRILAVPGPGVDGRCLRWATRLGVEVDMAPGEARWALRAGPPADGYLIAPGAAGFGDPELAAAVAAAGSPVVAVDPGNLRKAGVDPAASPLGRACSRVIYGRGDDTARYGLAHLVHRLARSWSTEAYGPHPDQVGDLWLPAPGVPVRAARPVAVLIHGGFWYHAWERDLMEHLAADLVDRGFAVWNIEHRRVGAGGGWPATGEDVAAGLDHLAGLASEPPGLDLGRVTVIGHSAGGQLALWAAGRPQAAVRPRLVVGLAAICDLAAARRWGIGGRSVDRLVATAPDPQAAIRDASPAEHVPLGVPQLLVHTDDDEQVPVAQSRHHWSTARRAGDAAELVVVPGGGHFSLIDPTSPAWAAVTARVGER